MKYEFLKSSERICGSKFMEYINEKFPGTDQEAGIFIIAMAKLRLKKRQKQLAYVEQQIESSLDNDWYVLRRLINIWITEYHEFINRFLGGNQ